MQQSQRTRQSCQTEATHKSSTTAVYNKRDLPVFSFSGVRGSNVKKRALVLLTALLSLSIVSAQAVPVLVSGQVNHTRTNQLTSEIQWNTSLYQAERTAAQQGKLVFWMHMLGTLSGAT
jgi:hypothetical protein